MSLFIKSAMVITLGIMLYLLVIEPSMRCWEIGGTVVRGMFGMECMK